MSNNQCPICKKTDRAQKVTSIVSEGTSRGSYSGSSFGSTKADGEWKPTHSYTSLSGSSRTDLASKLLPPKEPDNPPPFNILEKIVYGWFYIGSIIVALGLGEGAAGLLMTWAVGEGWVDVELSRSIAIAILIAIGLGYFITTVLIIKNYYEKKKQENTDRYERLKPIWDKAMEKYNRLYYCYRDDIVFDPKEGDYNNPRAFVDYLYSREVLGD